MSKPKKTRSNKKETLPTLENILNNHDEKTIYFDIIVRDFEVFAEFQIDRENHDSVGLISRIEFYGDVFWDYLPIGEVQVTVHNTDFFLKHGLAASGLRFLGVSKQILWRENQKTLDLWLQLMQLSSVKKGDFTMNIEFESFSVDDPEPKIPHNINSWHCKAIRVQSGSDRIAKRILER